jgi:hypothetical protein
MVSARRKAYFELSKYGQKSNCAVLCENSINISSKSSVSNDLYLIQNFAIESSPEVQGDPEIWMAARKRLYRLQKLTVDDLSLYRSKVAKKTFL